MAFLATGQSNDGLMGLTPPAPPPPPPQAAPQGQPPAPQGQPQQQLPAPQQASQQPQGFNGVLKYQGQQLPIKNGVGIEGDKKIFVSLDGTVVDEQKRILGSVDKQGNFTPTNKEHQDALIAAGQATEKPEGDSDAQ